MPSDLVLNSVSHIIDHAASELLEIFQAGAKALAPQGADVQPVKADMLGLPERETALVIETCNMLFAALCEYENGLWMEANAKDPMALVTARVNAGRADAVIKALFFGPTCYLLYAAMDRAPVAYSGLAKASPSQNIIDRTYKSVVKKNTT